MSLGQSKSIESVIGGITLTNENYMTVEEFHQYVNAKNDIRLNIDYIKRLITKLYKENPNDGKILKENRTTLVNKKWIYECIELCENSLDIDTAVKLIADSTNLNYSNYKSFKRNVVYKMSSLYNFYKVPFMDRTRNYISKTDVYSIIKAIKEVQSKECIYTSELLKIAREKFKGINFGSTSPMIFGFIRINGLEVIKQDNIANIFITNSDEFISKETDLYPKETVNKVIENIKLLCENGKVKLINMSYEDYFSLTKEKFEEDYIELSYKKFLELRGVKKADFKTYEAAFKETDVKCIWISKEGSYISKNEFEEFLDFTENYVNLRTYLNDDESAEGLTLLNIKRFLVHNSIDFKKYNGSCYIDKNDISKFLELRKQIDEFRNANTLYEKFMVKVKYYKSDKKDKYGKFNSTYFKFVEHTCKTNKKTDVVYDMFRVYKALVESIEVDIQPRNRELNDRLFQKTLLICGKSVKAKKTLIKFNKYLINKCNYSLSEIMDIRKVVRKEQYSAEAFINLLIKLIEIVADENNIKKLYRNWHLSTAVTYVFMHFTLAWRKMDLVEHLPTPDLRIIPGVYDGESFIQWLEKGNKLSGKMASDICNSIETITKRINLKANKNNQRLSCVISSSLSKEVATLICICEANKQIHISKSTNTNIAYKNLFILMCTAPKMIQEIIKGEFNIDINEVLQDSFDNIKMNKSFLELVKKKAEELDLAYSYYYAQVARGHKSNPGSISNTTKIYLEKDISKASLMAFATGTMGSVLHVILDLVDESYKAKTHLEQIESINALNITPYTIENNIMKITNKVSEIKTEIDEYLKGGGNKEEFFKKLLYGQTSYGINEKTKCLLKITRKNDFGIVRIKSDNYSDSNNIVVCPMGKKSCIGCDYMIALRYFIYEFSRRFEELVGETEQCETETDREICIDALNEIYIPVLNDLASIIGDEVREVIDIERYLRLVQNI